MRRNILLILMILATIVGLWLRKETEPVTATNDELAMALAERVVERYCLSTSMYHSIHHSENNVRISCEISAGHITSIHIQWHPSPQAAQDDFNSRRLGDEIVYVHGYPAAVWIKDAPTPPGAKNREMIWYAGQWVFFISSFDDTGYQIALDPLTVAETLYQFSIEGELFHSLPIQPD